MLLPSFSLSQSSSKWVYIQIAADFDVGLDYLLVFFYFFPL